MATISTEIAESLAQEDIPVKLRCASCNKLVLNAFRLPCCDQSICESCQTSLPDTCPVCAHSPLSPDDCKPNKALRLTVKAFLKNEEKKRDRERAAAAQPVEAATQDIPINSVESATSSEIPAPPTPTPAQDPGAGVESLLQPSETPAVAEESRQAGERRTDTDNAPSIENASASVRPLTEKEEGVELELRGESKDETVEDEKLDSNKPSGSQIPQQTFNGGFTGNQMSTGFDMNWNSSGFNPMMAMQNGMNQGGWNGFNNMMGMPGMGMDPMMMSQGMFGGFNGQGMGMNGMNMGMGFNGGYAGGWGMGGMNGNFGANAGYYPGNGYNQQSHQGHFNQMHNQQFPMNNYQQNRFNQGQGFHQRGHNHNQRYGGQDLNQGNRMHASKNQLQDTTSQQQAVTAEQDSSMHQDSKDAPVEPQDASTEAFAQTSDGTSTNENASGEQNPANDSGDNLRPDEDQAADLTVNSNINSNHTNNAAITNDVQVEEAKSPILQPIATIDTTGMSELEPDMTPMSALPPAIEPPIPSGPSAQYGNSNFSQDFSHPYRGRGRGYGRGGFDYRGGFRGRGGYYGNMGGSYEAPVPTPVEPIGQGVAGAPKGPKAMREGAPVTGFRGRGGYPVRGGRAGSIAPPALPHTSSSTAAIPQSASKSRSRSRSPSRRPRRESPVYEKYDDDEERSNEREYRKSRRQDDDEKEERRNGDSNRSREESDTSDSRHRSRHHSDKHHSSSRRERDYEREKDRDRRRRKHDQGSDNDEYSKDDDSHDRRRSSKDHSSTRRERDYEYDHEEKRLRRRDKERRRSHHHRSHSQTPDEDTHTDDYESSSRHRAHSHHHSSSRSSRPKPEGSYPAPTKTDGPPPSAPKGPAALTKPEIREFKIQGRSKMQPPAPPSAPTGPKSDLDIAKQQVRAERPDIDEHALEREARNRERLLKEQQRRGMSGLRGGAAERKRSFAAANNDDMNGDEGSGSSKRGKTGGKGRRVSYQYEDEDEDRAARVEREREAERWR